jgi:uncharacterized caspase-like protein
LKAYYTSFPDGENIEDNVDTAEETVELLQRLRTNSLEDDDAPAVILDGGRWTLITAPAGDKVAMMYADDNQSFMSVYPDNQGDDTFWFTYGGSPTEVDSRNAVPLSLAITAVTQFMADSSVLPEVQGFVWEED